MGRWKICKNMPNLTNMPNQKLFMATTSKKCQISEIWHKNMPVGNTGTTNLDFELPLIGRSQWIAVMESRDLVSLSRLVSRVETYFCQSRSWRFQVSSRSWSRRLQVSRLSILHKNGLVKFLYFNDFLFVVFADKKQTKQIGKLPKTWKKIQRRCDADFLFLFSVKCTNFEVCSLGFEFQVSVSGFLMKSQSRSHYITCALYSQLQLCSCWFLNQCWWCCPVRKHKTVVYCETRPRITYRGSAGPMEHGHQRNIYVTSHLVTVFSCYVVVNIVFMDNSVVR